jgi:hypothetical protein
VNRAKLIAGTYKHIVFQCPGCDSPHVLPVEGPQAWGWNGSVEKPTLTPSVFVNPGGYNETVPQCHSFVTDGFIRFLDDCTHALAGKNVELPEIHE